MPAYEDEEDYWDQDPADSDEDEEPEDPEDLEDVIAQGEELSDFGEHRKALRLWRRHIDRFSDEVDAQFSYGQAAFRVLEEQIVTERWWNSDAELVTFYEESLGALEEAVSIDEEHAPSWNLMGALFALRQNHDSAISCWEKSLEINPDQPEVKSDLKEARERG